MEEMFDDMRGENQTVDVKIAGFGRLAETVLERVLRDTIPNAETNSETPHTDRANLVIVAVGTDDEKELNAACDFIRTAKAKNALLFSVVFPGNGPVNRIKSEADVVFAAPSEEAFTEALSVLYRYMALFLENECVVGVDISDLKAMFTDAGEAFLGVGFDACALDVAFAAKDAMAKPIAGSFLQKFRSVLVGIAGNETLEILEFRKAIDVISATADEDAGILWCFSAGPNTDAVRVIVVAA